VILFCLGGISFHLFKILPYWLSFILFLSFLTGVFLLKNNQRKLKSLLLYACYFSMGYLNFQTYYHQPKTHYLQNPSSETVEFKRIRILEKLYETSFTNAYLTLLESKDTKPASGKLILYQEKDSLSAAYRLGEKILTTATIVSIDEPRNPGAFSYKKYLENLGVYGQLNLNSNNGWVVESSVSSFQFWFARLRKILHSKIEDSVLHSESKSMLQALLLAERKAIGEERIEEYAWAGVLHLLALSGLHIGLIVELLLLLLSPLRWIRYGNYLRLSLILVFLWGFTLFVGLPASVVRASTLFSFLTVGRFIHHGKNTFHFTVVSFLVLLLAHPPFLRQIGFQFSFLAVFGILWIHPLLQRLWNPKIGWIKKYWQWTTVSLAAQIAVGPLSVYYFHQFPSLFLISNLLIVPFFGLFLFLVLGVFILLMVDLLPHFLVGILDSTVHLLNGSVSWIAQNDPFRLDQLYLSIPVLLGLYIFLFFLVLILERKPFFYKVGTAVSFLILLSLILYEKKNTAKEHVFWIFHLHNQSSIGYLKSGVFYHHSSNSEKSQRIHSDFANSRSLYQFQELSVKNFFSLDSFHLLILDDEKSYTLPNYRPTHILLQNDAKINLDRLLQIHQPQLIISDGSNSPWMTERWRQSCEKYAIPFYNTRKSGALKINLGNEG
jgi:competence protein ComEC